MERWRSVCDTEPVSLGLIHKLIALSAILSLAAVGCAAPKKVVTPHEADYDWSEYKGTFAPGGSGKEEEPKEEKKVASTSSTSTSTTSTTSGATASASDAPAASDSSASEDPKPSAPLLPRKPSKTKIRGKSVSSVSPDALAGASKGALKSKVVSSNLIVGPEYEMVQVVLKGASVQIVRPATSPDQSGPKLRSPKVRNDGLSETESGWYDADADVLVLVQAPKSATSKKALKALLKK
jgi:hypothetical protein